MIFFAETPVYRQFSECLYYASMSRNRPFPVSWGRDDARTERFVWIVKMRSEVRFLGFMGLSRIFREVSNSFQ